MPRPVPVRGVVEGFYGPPWTPAARLHAVDFLGARGMNAYVYAPKDEPKHRERWRDAYDTRELAHFEELVTACRDAGMRLGFAISPGLDVAYRDPLDREALRGKLTPLLERGVDWVMLALDDIELRPGLASEQGELATWLHGSLGDDVRLSVVPTEYVGTRPTAYLADLSAALPIEVDICWTGPTVCAPRITVGDARSWRAATGDRPLLLWDNYPVNDTVMSSELHLGPYRGREPGLGDVVEGVLCNPMPQCHASLVGLATAAAFLVDPGGYDEDDAWSGAIDDVGGPHRDALRVLARSCATGPLLDPADLPARRLVDDLAASGTGDGPAAGSLRDELRALRAAREEWPDDPGDELRHEVTPWLDQGAREADAGLAALRLLRGVATDAGEVDAADLMLRCFALLFAWSAAREGAPVVLGPRFSIHPAVVQRADGSPAVDVALALHEDGSAVDRLCRLALERYRQWVAGTGGS